MQQYRKKKKGMTGSGKAKPKNILTKKKANRITSTNRQYLGFSLCSTKPFTDRSSQTNT